jgi:hypothetical protein
MTLTDEGEAKRFAGQSLIEGESLTRSTQSYSWRLRMSADPFDLARFVTA